MSGSEVVTVAAVAAFVVLLAVVWQVDRKRKRPSGSATAGVLGGFDEVFHPEAARAMEVREIQHELPTEAPAPGDPLVPGEPVVIYFKQPPS